MSTFDLTDILNDCAARLSNGQTIDDCLRMYPQYAADLRPMLEVMLLVRRVSPTSFEVAQARDRVRFRVAEAAAELRARRTLPGLRLLPLVASFIVVFAIVFTVASFGAETSLPGDSLYPLKRFTENARVVVLQDEALAGQFVQRRLDEIRQLQVLQREAEVDFRGLVEQIDGTDWRIAGLTVAVSESVLAGSSSAVGDTVAIEARVTADGTVTVNRLDILDRGEPALLPEATEDTTSTVQPTLTTPSPTATLPPTMTRTPQATATAQPTLTNTLPPTATLPPTMTRTPRPPATPAPARADCSSALPEGWVLHTITVGETMSRLASVTGVSLEELMEINCITNPSLIHVGQPIYLPFEPSLPQSSQQGGSSGSQPSGSSSSGSGTSSGGSSGDSSNDDDGGDDDNSGSSGSGSGEDAGDIEDDDGSGEDDDFEDDDGSSGDDDGGDDDNGGSGGDDGSDGDGGGDDDDNGDDGDD